MKSQLFKLEITFITEPLGTQPQYEVAEKYIGEKFVENGGELPPDELETLDQALTEGTTGFHKLDGQPIFYDYQIKGFLKEAGRIFNGLDGVKALRSKIDNLVFVEPRRIPLAMPAGSKIDYLERPLRAETAQGPRIALARSEKLPIGTCFTCNLKVYDGPVTEDILRALLSYGADKGLGQWRNGGWGRFEFTLR